MHTRTTPSGPSALARKISIANPLGPDDIGALEAIQSDTRSVPAKSDILREGRAFDGPIVLRSGWVYSWKSLSDGRRQIVGFLLPGDLFGLFGHFPKPAPVSLSSLTPVEIADISADALNSLLCRSPALTAAFAWMIERDMTELQEHVVRLGRMNARERTAHLLLELYHRLRAVGLVGDPHFRLPLSQVELSDMLGLSGVHMNRTLRALRREGLIDLQRRWITIADLDRLKLLADFREQAFLGLRQS